MADAKGDDAHIEQKDPKNAINSLLQKISVVLSQSMAQAAENRKAEQEARQPQFQPKNQGIRRYSAPTPVVPPPMGSTQAPTPQAQPAQPQQQQGAGMNSPSANPIQSFGPLSASGNINGNAAFGQKNSPDSLKTALDKWAYGVYDDYNMAERMPIYHGDIPNEKIPEYLRKVDALAKKQNYRASFQGDRYDDPLPAEQFISRFQNPGNYQHETFPNLYQLDANKPGFISRLFGAKMPQKIDEWRGERGENDPTYAALHDYFPKMKEEHKAAAAHLNPWHKQVQHFMRQGYTPVAAPDGNVTFQKGDKYYSWTHDKPGAQLEELLPEHAMADLEYAGPWNEPELKQAAGMGRAPLPLLDDFLADDGAKPNLSLAQPGPYNAGLHKMLQKWETNGYSNSAYPMSTRTKVQPKTLPPVLAAALHRHLQLPKHITPDELDAVSTLMELDDANKTAAAGNASLARIMGMDYSGLPDPEELDCEERTKNAGKGLLYGALAGAGAGLVGNAFRHPHDWNDVGRLVNYATGNDSDAFHPGVFPSRSLDNLGRNMAEGAIVGGSAGVGYDALKAMFGTQQTDEEDDNDDNTRAKTSEESKKKKKPAQPVNYRRYAMAGALTGSLLSKVLRAGYRQYQSRPEQQHFGPESYHHTDLPDLSDFKYAMLGDKTSATPCSCGCGDTVTTCKCGPDCKCRKPSGSCYKPEKATKESALGLWDRIRMKKERGEKPAKPGSKDYPDAKSWKKVTAISEKKSDSPAWQRSAGKNDEGGLNAKGRASYNKATGGHLKAPVTEKNPTGKAKARRHSFCSRMCGMKKHETGSATAHDPDSRINKSLRKWNCKCSAAVLFGEKVSNVLDDYTHQFKQLYNPENYGVDVRLPDNMNAARQMAVAAAVGGGLGLGRGLIWPGYHEKFDDNGRVITKKRRAPWLGALEGAAIGAGTSALSSYASQTLHQYDPEINNLMRGIKDNGIQALSGISGDTVASK
jgi:hypothetical protein